MTIEQFAAMLDKWAVFAIRSHDDMDFRSRDIAYSIIGQLRGECTRQLGASALVDHYLATEV